MREKRGENEIVLRSIVGWLCFIIYDECHCGSPLSGRRIWFGFGRHQRGLCHFAPWNMSFHFGRVSKELVWPGGVKVETEKGWLVKEWKFWKTEEVLLYQFFNWFNFAFMVFGWFPLGSGLKVEFVLFEAEKVTARQRFKIPAASLSPSASKGTNFNFEPFLGGNWQHTIKARLNQLGDWCNKMFSVFQNSHSLTTHPIWASVFAPLGHANFFETCLTWRLVLRGVKWHSFRWWCLKLNQIILPDRGGLQSDTSYEAFDRRLLCDFTLYSDF